MKMALSTIQPIGSNPYNAPCTAAIPARLNGIPYTRIATSNAATNPRIAARCAFT